MPLAACAPRSPSYLSPHESFLAITNEYQLVRGTDPYRQPFPQDLTGQNAARAVLVRLANYEDLYPGKFTPELEYLRAQALADLGEYAASRDHFLLSANYDTPLRPKARESAAIADEIQTLLERPLDNENLDAHLADRERQIADLRALAERLRGTRWESLARIEIESAQVARAELLATNQFAIVDGSARARRAFEQLVEEHPESRRSLSHALRLAQFHIDQARLLERLHDPERGGFDFPTFSTHLEIALDLLHRVSLADGHPEKIIARHRLDETLAYYDMIRERAQ